MVRVDNKRVFKNQANAQGEVIVSVETAMPIEFSESAAIKVKALIAEEENPNLKLRVYITGGGCSGFQYGFTFDEKVNEGDMTIEKNEATLVVDPMSLQYLVGGVVDYTEGLEGSRFLVNNPNATTTCGCGASFSV
jgi:iron-sulfur cluster insertion protein